jgi:type I restriction enzyme R subunit
MMDKLVNLSRLGSVREVANNFGGIKQMNDEYLELWMEIYR